jgi:hypothetical protein
MRYLQTKIFQHFLKDKNNITTTNQAFNLLAMATTNVGRTACSTILGAFNQKSG